MDDTITPKRRGRPKSDRPARSSAEKMREARERVQAALNAPGGDVGTLPDSLLLEALAVAFRKRMAYDFWFAVQALTERLNARLPADQRLYLTREWGADRDTVTEKITDTVTAIEADSQTAGESRHSDRNTNGITDTVTHIDNDTVTEITETTTDTVTDVNPVTVTAIPEPFALAPDAPAKPVSNGLAPADDTETVQALLHCSSRWARELTRQAREQAKAARDAEIQWLAEEGKSQREIAKQVGVTQQSISKLLYNKRNSSESCHPDPTSDLDAERNPSEMGQPPEQSPPILVERDARILELAATGAPEGNQNRAIQRDQNEPVERTAGMKKRTIGTTLGVPESTVRWVIKQHGV